MPRRMKSYQVHFDESEHELFDKIEMARNLKGMGKKTFFLYAVANMVPELAAPVIEHLTRKPYSKNSKAVRQEVNNATDSMQS